MSDRPPRETDPSRSTQDTPSVPPAPMKIGSYRILRKLGEGGMGVVYEAEQQSPRRLVALKVIRGGSVIDETTLKMFQREIEVLARLKHPRIAAIYESGRTEDGQHYFAMELVRGPTLAEWLKNRRTADAEDPQIELKLALFAKICEAVAYAHQRGVIHRDLKPSNILMLQGSATTQGLRDVPTPEIKILDFGLARITGADIAATSFHTDVGRVAGTFPYMSPEQTRGNPDEIDFRSDVYSLGVILYEMLTGQLPYDFDRAALHEIVRVICEEAPRPLTRTWPGLRRPDADIETIVGKTLAKEPVRRYQSVFALAEEIERYLSGQPILARPPSALYVLRKLVRRHRMAFGFTVTVSVMLIAFAVTVTVQAQKIAIERDRALLEAQRVKLESDGYYAAFRENYPRAVSLLRQALALHRRALGNNNPELVPYLNNFAGCLDLFGGGSALSSGSPGEIEALYREALNIRRRSLPAGDPRILESLKVLAEHLRDSRDPRRAEPLYREILSYRTDSASPKADSLRVEAQADLAADMRDWGVQALGNGDRMTADSCFREALGLIRKIPDSDLRRKRIEDDLSKHVPQAGPVSR